MNLDGLSTQTTVQFDKALDDDEIFINQMPASDEASKRVTDLLDIVRGVSGMVTAAKVNSQNNFPMGSGIASSASAFAALSLAASRAAGLCLDEVALSRLARRGSGSACRSIPAGIVAWHAGTRDEDSFAEQLVPSGHWDLVDCLAVVSENHKTVGSTDGHRLASTSPLQGMRVTDSDRRYQRCRQAILNKDFELLADVIEQDSNLMHSVMSTSKPELIYWTEATLNVIHMVSRMRKIGLEAAYTIDAGPNVHVITLKETLNVVETQLANISGILHTLSAPIGGGVRLVALQAEPS